MPEEIGVAVAEPEVSATETAETGSETVETGQESSNSIDSPVEKQG